MKDAFGHGSNSREGSLTSTLRSRLSNVTSLRGAPSGGVAMTSNAAAGAALASTLKATQAPVHDAMTPTEFDDGMGGLYRPGVVISAGQNLVRDRRGGSRGSRSFGDKPITNLKGVHR